MEYQLEKWKRQDWRKGTRHYCCEVKQNIFGNWIVLKRWGRVSAFQGQSREVKCERYEEGLKILETVTQHRVKRGYIRW